MKSPLLYSCLVLLAAAVASCGQSDADKAAAARRVPDASGVTPQQRADASAAFRSGHFDKSKPGKYEWTAVEPKKPEPAKK